MNGGFWLILIWVIVSLPLALAVGRVIGFGDGTDDERDDTGADEREAIARIYELRSFERRTENVGPRNTQKWS